MATYAGVDLGASNLRAIVVDGHARPLAQASRETPPGPDGGAIEAAIGDLLRTVMAEAGVDPTAIEAAAIACMGPLDRAAGTVESPANLSGIDRVRVRAPVAAVIDGGRVAVHNDATAGVIGERFHLDPAPPDLVYLTLSSGIGVGVTVDGHVLHGRDGNVGEVGHLIVDPADGRPCGCGRDGHWEAYCGGEQIPAYARALQAAEPVETDLPLAAPDFSAAAIFAAAGADPLADRVIGRVAHWNAIGVANVVHAFGPAVVAIGGAVALRNPGTVVDPIRERLDEMVVTDVPEVRLATLGEDAVLGGAVASAITGGTGERSGVANGE